MNGKFSQASDAFPSSSSLAASSAPAAESADGGWSAPMLTGVTGTFAGNAGFIPNHDTNTGLFQFSPVFHRCY